MAQISLMVEAVLAGEDPREVARDLLLPDISFEIYCEALDQIRDNPLDEGLLDRIRDLNIPGKLIGFFKDLKGILDKMADSFQADLGDLVAAFKQRDVFGVLKAFGFSLSRILRALNEFTSLIRKGILGIFEELSRTGVFQKLKAGTMKIDELLDRYPLLKKIGGLAIAGLLIYIWLNMTFIGDLDFDMDLSAVALAVKGSYSLTNLFMSPSGLTMLALLGTGMAGFSAPWLGKAAYNLILAILYTGLKRLKGSPKAQALAQKIKGRVGKG